MPQTLPNPAGRGKREEAPVPVAPGFDTSGLMLYDTQATKERP